MEGVLSVQMTKVDQTIDYIYTLNSVYYNFQIVKNLMISNGVSVIYIVILPSLFFCIYFPTL